MTGNIKEEFVEWCNRCDRKTCDKCNRHIQKRNWEVLNEPALYAGTNVSFGGIVVSAIFMFAAIWRFGEHEWFAVPLLIFTLLYFFMVLYLNRKYKNRVRS